VLKGQRHQRRPRVVETAGIGRQRARPSQYLWPSLGRSTATRLRGPSYSEDHPPSPRPPSRPLQLVTSHFQKLRFWPTNLAFCCRTPDLKNKSAVEPLGIYHMNSAGDHSMGTSPYGRVEVDDGLASTSDFVKKLYKCVRVQLVNHMHVGIDMFDS